ncbi:MAG: lipoyl(octanoyl) transferase LipB [Planctomycetota bacterium]
MSLPPALVRVDLGRIGYREAWELQLQRVEERRRGEGQDTLLLCEHPEIVTTGRGAQGPSRSAEETAGVTAAGIEVLPIERGGAATYHGPGQLVGYPIVRLAPDERDLHAFLRALEAALIAALARCCGLAAGRRDGLTGVWVGERKLASIGIACRGWVTYHGFALNLSTDLRRFALFRPCDLDAQVMASLESLGVPAEREPLAAAIHQELCARLGRAFRVERP